MVVSLLLAFILGHLLTEFVLQTDKSCKKKSDPVFRLKILAHLYYIGIYALVSWLILVLFGLGLWTHVLAAGILAVIHGIVDYLKSLGIGRMRDFPLLLVDQILHGTSILATVALLYPGELTCFFTLVLDNLKCYHSAAGVFTVSQKILIAVNMLVIVTAGANVLIRSVLRSLNIKMTFKKDQDSPGDDAVKTGRYIGAIERILTIFALLVGSYQSIVALYAAKTAVRFKQVSDDFQEYYILGTLLSLLIGIVSGTLLKLLL